MRGSVPRPMRGSSSTTIAIAALLSAIGFTPGCSKKKSEAAAAGSASAAVAAVGTPAPAPSGAPLPVDEQDFLSRGIRANLCEAGSCGGIACEKFSEGRSNVGLARVARCRWNDRREPSNAARCTYLLYSFDAQGSVTNVLPAAPTKGEACLADKAFTDSARQQANYTGSLP
jgi:hypothetical protein